MIFETNIAVKETIDERVAKRDKQAEIILKILDLAKELEYCNYEVSEKVRFANYINEKDIEGIRQRLDVSFWNQTLNEHQVEKFLTTTDKEKLFERLAENTPTFNFNNVMETLETFKSSKDARASEMISKIHNTISDAVFRLGNKHSAEGQKRLQTGVKKSFRLSVFYIYRSELPSYISSNNSNFNMIDDFERALYLCDGKTQPDRQKNITSLTDDVLRKDGMLVDSPYFKMKIFKNGNVKIDIKDEKVLETFNKWGRKENTLEGN